MGKDKIYSEKYGKVPPFEFNSRVVDVFDDMIHRSVPLYNESMGTSASGFFQPWVKRDLT
jgi:tRNA (cmo5U34)-methyltransferase